MRKLLIALVALVALCSTAQAQHRYWRLLFNSINGVDPSGTVILDLKANFYASGAIISTGGTASASSYYNIPPYVTPPAQAFDQITPTPSNCDRWASVANPPLPQWLEYDFGSAKTPDSVSLAAVANLCDPTTSYVARTPNSWSVQWSDDNATWTTAQTFTTPIAGWTDNVFRSFTIPVPPPPQIKTNPSAVVTSSVNPSANGQSVTLTATVTKCPCSPQTAIPTGTVTFKDGAATIGTGTLTNGVATFSTSTLAAGGHSITVVYGGDAGNNAATSPALTQTVVQTSTTTFYFAANGLDTNPCTLAAPCLTIGKINATVYNPGQTVLFRGGDTFAGNIKPQLASGGLCGSPVTFGSYGTGKATLNPTVGGVGQGIINLDTIGLGVTIQDLIIAAPSTTTQPRGGIRIANNSANLNGCYLIQRNELWGIRFNSNVSADWGALIMIEGTPGSGGVDRITVKNNDLHGEAGLTSLTDAGLSGFGGQPFTNVTITGNLCWNIGTAGAASLNGGVVYPPLGQCLDFPPWTNGGLEKYNISHDNAANYNNAGGGPVAYMSVNSTGLIFRFNEGYNVQPTTAFVAADFGGLDFDNSTASSTAEFNYMHDNFNFGFMHFDRGGGIYTWDNNTFRKNLSVNNGKAGMTGFYEFTIDACGTMHVDNNVAFNDRVYPGPQFQTLGQGAGFVSLPSCGFGTITNNVGVVGANIYGEWNLVNARNNTSAAPTITGNRWFMIGGSNDTYWWGATEYFGLAAFQTASGASGNTAVTGSGPTLFPTATLNLTAAERTTAVSALQAIQSLPGIASGNGGTTTTPLPLPGTRAASLITRFQAGDSPVTLPEYIVLGLALTRCEAPCAALLNRIEQIELAQ